MPQASSLGAEITAKLGAQPELIGGVKGVFDVVADGALIFSKHHAGRFPDASEVLEALRKLM